MFLTLLIISMSPIPDPDVGISVIVCDVEHIYFHFGMCRGTFVDLCLFIAMNVYNLFKLSRIDSVAEWLRAWDTLTMFEATVCGRS